MRDSGAITKTWKNSRPNYQRLKISKVYFDTIARTDFKDKESLDTIYQMFNTPNAPFITIGSHKGYAYRLAPSTSDLSVELDDID
jgi:hypothetical protein